MYEARSPSGQDKLRHTTDSLPKVFRRLNRTGYGKSQVSKYSTTRTRTSRSNRNNKYKFVQPSRPKTSSSIHQRRRNNNSNSNSPFNVKFQKRFFYPLLPGDLINTSSVPSDDHWDYSYRDKRKLIEKSFIKLYPILNKKSIHEGVKSCYVQDLFQIAHFYFNESKINAKEIQNLEAQRQMMEERITSTEKSDFDLISESPTNEDFKQMIKSLERLKGDVKKYTLETTKQTFKDTLPVMQKKKSETPKKPSDEEEGEFVKEKPMMDVNGENYLNLIREKFEVLETFVVYLKKRISILEQSDDDIKTLMQDYGSVKELLNEMVRLKKELKNLSRVKVKFDTDVLLDRKLVNVKSPMFLRSTIIGLQNELINSKELLNLLISSNDSNKRKNNRLFDWYWSTKYTSLENLLKDEFQTNLVEEIKKKLNPDEEEKLILSLLSSDRVSEMKEINETHNESEEVGLQTANRKILILEYEIKQLKENCERYQKQCQELDKSLSLIESLVKNSEGKFQLKELSTSLRRQMDTLTKRNKEMEEREVRYVHQEKLIEQMRNERKELLLKLALVKEQMEAAKLQTRQLQSRVKCKNMGVDVLKRISLSLIKATYEKKTGRVISDEEYQKLMYSQIYKKHYEMVNSAIKLQSWWRGVSTRRNLLKKGFYNVKIRNEKKKSYNKLDPMEEKEKKSKLGPDGTHLDSLMDSFCMIQKVCLHSGNKSNMNELKTVLKLMKEEVTISLKNRVGSELSRTRKEINDMKVAVVEKIRDYETRERKDRSSQTDSIKSSSVSLQTGATQIMKVTIRHTHIAAKEKERILKEKKSHKKGEKIKKKKKRKKGKDRSQR